MRAVLTIIYLIFLTGALAPAHAGKSEKSGKSAQALYLSASKQELAGSFTKAAELYEEIITH